MAGRIDWIISGLFVPKVIGELSAERFSRMLAIYEDGQVKLRERNGGLTQHITAE